MAPVPAPTINRPVPARRRVTQRGSGRAAMLFILPSLIGFGVFYVTPLIRGIYQSLTQYDILQPPQFIGLGTTASSTTTRSSGMR